MAQHKATEKRPGYLTNGRVAWSLPPGQVGLFFMWGVYRCPDEWSCQAQVIGVVVDPLTPAARKVSNTG